MTMGLSLHERILPWVGCTTLIINTPLYSQNILIQMIKCMMYMMCVCTLSCISCFLTPRNVAHQAPLFMEFSRQESWSELPFPTSGALPNLSIEHLSLVSAALTGRFFTAMTTGKPKHVVPINHMGPNAWDSGEVKLASKSVEFHIPFQSYLVELLKTNWSKRHEPLLQVLFSNYFVLNNSQWAGLRFSADLERIYIAVTLYQVHMDFSS